MRARSEFTQGFVGAGDETFNFIAKCWNVSHARAILAEEPRDGGQYPLVNVRPFIGAIRDEGKEAIETADLDEPILLVAVPFEEEGDKGHYLFPIDGWHRIKKAIGLGLKEIPGVALTLEESEEATLL